MDKTLHFISHTHWDREWYMSFEKFRIRLVELLDRLIETLDNNPDFKSFHMDGQIMPILDYLEIRPQMREKIKKYIQDGRIYVGPWYILQDVYLISAEANVRNLLIGINECKKFGEPLMVGYLPDTFGNISQTAQILNGFGIDDVVFGRGLGTVLPNNTISGDTQRPSELIWYAPDGSKVMGIYFANWYHNAMEIPNEPEKALERVNQISKNAENFALTDHLLLMNGCDHQPVQVELPSILKSVESLTDYNIIHSNFKDYMKAVRPYIEQFPAVEGELYGQDTIGANTLINTASSRMYQKVRNHTAQVKIERWVEPIGVMSYLCGDIYREQFIDYSWKTLLQNHPHDSICGCSTDEVALEMMTRFQKSIDVSDCLIEREKEYLCSKIKTDSLDLEAIPVVIFNPFLWSVKDNFTVVVDYPENVAFNTDNICAFDSNGNALLTSAKHIGKAFKYILPEKTFRKTLNVNRYEITFEAKNIKSLGYSTFYIKATGNYEKSSLICNEKNCENSLIYVKFNDDGSLDIKDKTDNFEYKRIHIFENVKDLGNEYNFIGENNAKPILSKDRNANICLVEQNKVKAVYSIKCSLPSVYDDGKFLNIETLVTIYSNTKRIDFKTKIDNQIESHRLRVLFKSGMKTNNIFVEGHYDILKRPIREKEKFKNPCHANRQLFFARIEDEQKGIIISNKGLPEYEMLTDETTYALTLLRCVGEIGDWGYFPTPDAQCKGINEFEYAFEPYCLDNISVAVQNAYQFSVAPFEYCQVPIQDGDLPDTKSFFSLDNSKVMITAFKKSEKGDGIILRMYNQSEEIQKINVNPYFSCKKIYLTNLNEEPQNEILDGQLEIAAKKIITLLFE